MKVEKKKSGKKSLISISLFTLIGLIISIYATQQTLLIYNFQSADPGICEANTWISCDKAQASSEAIFLGIPVAWWGFLYYLWIGLAALWTLIRQPDRKDLVQVAYLLTLISMVIILYKAVIMFFILNILCPVCILMYTLNIIIFILILRYPGRSDVKIRELFVVTLKEKNKTDLKTSQVQQKWFLLLGFSLVFGLGFLGMKGYMSTLDQLNLDVDKEVTRFYQQQPITADLSEFTPMWGNEKGNINILVISDFQCPSCRQAAFQLPLLLSEYEKHVRLYFINFPLDRRVNPTILKTIHSGSGIAARAAICAQHKPEFHEFHNDLFRYSDNLDIPLIMKLAERRPWDIKEFAACLFSKESYENLQKHIKLANTFQITGTPAVIINGRQALYWFQPDILRGILKMEMGKD